MKSWIWGPGSFGWIISQRLLSNILHHQGKLIPYGLLSASIQWNGCMTIASDLAIQKKSCSFISLGTWILALELGSYPLFLSILKLLSLLDSKNIGRQWCLCELVRIELQPLSARKTNSAQASKAVMLFPPYSIWPNCRTEINDFPRCCTSRTGAQATFWSRIWGPDIEKQAAIFWPMILQLVLLSQPTIAKPSMWLNPLLRQLCSLPVLVCTSMVWVRTLPPFRQGSKPATGVATDYSWLLWLW